MTRHQPGPLLRFSALTCDGGDPTHEKECGTFSEVATSTLVVMISGAQNRGVQVLNTLCTGTHLYINFCVPYTKPRCHAIPEIFYLVPIPGKQSSKTSLFCPSKRRC